MAAKPNLHPVGVYLALCPYGKRRWALTPPLHNHLLMGYGLRNNQPSERRRIIAAHTFALALLIKCVTLRFASLGRTGILLFCGTVLTLTRTKLSLATRLFGCPDFPHKDSEPLRDYPPTFFLNNYTRKLKFAKILNYDRYTFSH